MGEHTKGPWRVIIDDTGGAFTGWPSVVAAAELDTTIVHRAGFKQEFWGDLSLRESLANARLFAAAPAMKEALEAMLRHSGVADMAPEDKDEEDHKAERMARAALAATEDQ